MLAFILYRYFTLKANVKWYRTRTLLSLFTIFLVWYINCLPDKLFADSTSTVLLDRNGQLLGAHISKDEQWRFEENANVPKKFETCIIEFEDRRFYSHWGVSIKGIARAISQNFSSGKKVSGASTLTMQLVRLMRKNPPRTYSEKVYEMIVATRIEWGYSKEEILGMYCSHAPFGNNVVGLDAASWRFFGRPADELSWAESATLAVLPNAPGLIYPGRNQDQLKAKRNRLLKRIRSIGKMTKTEYEMALLEPLPSRPHPLPNIAPHMLNRLMSNGYRGRTVKCTIDSKMQAKVNRTLEDWMKLMRENEIHNGAVMISSVKTGEILSYVGNAYQSGNEHSNQVNCIEAPRSTGSILKPLLYAKSLEAGLISPKMLLQDVPSKFGAFAPKNFNGDFEGLVPADQALSRSLNIPMVHLINRYGITKFHSDLHDLGFTTINRSSHHYGLSLILGGAEVKLREVNAVYMNLAQSLGSDTMTNTHFLGSDRRLHDGAPLDKACIYKAFDAMLEVKRPYGDNNWKLFDSSQKIAWKTGTSYGFRDAWAVGVTPDYVVSVWIGNADGEGRPGLTGIQAAAPVLFDVFDHLPKSNSWFERPHGRMQQTEICLQSGHRASSYCDEKKSTSIPSTAMTSRICPYHTRVHLNQSGTYRVDSECASPSEMQHVNWFVIPSKIEKYYKDVNPAYLSLPPYDESCMSKISEASIAILYPRRNQKIYLPYDFEEERRKVVFEATNRNSDELIYWHLDGVYYGQTRGIHQLEFQPAFGDHKLTLMAENGSKKTVHFKILGKQKSSN